MKTANIPVYGNIAVYIKYCAVCLKIDYTLICLEYICLESSPLRHLDRDDTDKCTLTITKNMYYLMWEDFRLLIEGQRI